MGFGVMKPPENPSLLAKRTYELRQTFGIGLLQEGIESVPIAFPGFLGVLVRRYCGKAGGLVGRVASDRA